MPVLDFVVPRPKTSANVFGVVVVVPGYAALIVSVIAVLSLPVGRAIVLLVPSTCMVSLLLLPSRLSPEPSGVSRVSVGGLPDAVSVFLVYDMLVFTKISL